MRDREKVRAVARAKGYGIFQDTHNDPPAYKEPDPEKRVIRRYLRIKSRRPFPVDFKAMVLREFPDVRFYRGQDAYGWLEDEEQDYCISITLTEEDMQA